MTSTMSDQPLPTKRICYFCPDYPQPSGGAKTLYRHVHRLLQAGGDATIVHQKHDFHLDWHAYPAPVIWLEDRPQFGPDDILVFPEVMADMIRQTKGFAGQRAVISLSWQPSYARLQPGERWQDYGITHVITTSPAIRRHLTWCMEIEVSLVPEFIDPTLYAYRPAEKANRIAYLTRKDASGEWLRGVLSRRDSALAEYEWTPLRNLDESTYARHLRQSSVYLATTLQEGMHISVLEAMACGCLVIGYSGIGGADYMVGEGPNQNCLLVENGNLLLLGQTLEGALHELRCNPDRYETVRANATATAKRYQDAAAETASLAAFFSELGG